MAEESLLRVLTHADTNVSQVEGGKYKSSPLAYSLQSFVELMDHGIVSWDILEPPFISKVSSYVNNQAAVQDANVIEASLSILENIVLNSSGKYAQVEKEVTLQNLVSHLQSMSPQIQQNAIALLNALFTKADIAKRRTVAATLQSKEVRNVFLTNVIQSTGQVKFTNFKRHSIANRHLFRLARSVGERPDV